MTPDVTAPSLHHFGDADEYLPVDEVVAGLPGTEIHRYPGAGHAFDNPMPAFHDIDASALAWERTVEFLNRNPDLRPVRGLFVAQEIRPQAKVLAADRRIEWLEVDYDDLRGIERPQQSLF